MKKKTGFNWWCDRAWLYVGLVLSALVMVLMLINWNVWSVGLKIVAMNAILVPVHALEEWIFPGGFHYQYNVMIYNSDTPHCYPMNRGSDMYTVFVTTVMYVCMVLFCMANGNYVYPGWVMGTVIFCILELFGHIFMGTRSYFKFKDKGKKTIYGPGSITCFWIFVPMAVIGLDSLKGQQLDTFNWIMAIGIDFVILLFVLVPEFILKRKDSPYYYESFGYFERFMK